MVQETFVRRATCFWNEAFAGSTRLSAIVDLREGFCPFSFSFLPSGLLEPVDLTPGRGSGTDSALRAVAVKERPSMLSISK